MIESALNGFWQAIQPINLLLTFAGTFLGILVGAIPGLSSPMAIVVLLPITYGMDTLSALLLLIGIYVGTKLGGSYPAILLRTPGTPAAACTVLDGHKMAERGDAGLALGYATMGSTFGSIFGWLSCLIFAPLIASIALKAGNADIALIGIIGLVMVSIFTRGSMLKGLIGVALGLLVSTVGNDPISGVPRYTFGSIDLMSGVPFISALVGVFALGVVLIDIKIIGTKSFLQTDKINFRLPSLMDTLKRWPALLIGSIYGVLVGAIPGVGAEGSTWLAYATVKKKSKNPELFGTGIPEGILTPESSNNAVTGGALIPMLTLGIPGDGSTAIMLGAIMLHGLNPGVTLFKDSPVLVYGMIAGLLTSAIFMFLISWKAIKPFVIMLQRDRSWIFPFILVFATIGAYANNNTVYPVYVALVFGVLGYIMEKSGFPVVPLVLAIILGPIIEENMRLALALSSNDWYTFIATWPRKLFVLVLLYLVYSEVYSGYKSRKTAQV